MGPLVDLQSISHSASGSVPNDDDRYDVQLHNGAVLSTDGQVVQDELDRGGMDSSIISLRLHRSPGLYCSGDAYQR